MSRTSSKGKWHQALISTCHVIGFYMIFTESLISGNDFVNPRKSIFKQTCILHNTSCRIGSPIRSESFRRSHRNISPVMAPGVMMTPQACVPVLRTEPSRDLARFTGFCCLNPLPSDNIEQLIYFL